MSDVKLVWVTPDAEKHIAYCARVSSPNNQDNPEYSKLIRYLVDHKHWSPLEMAHMCIEITTSRAISAQLLRHKSFSFQEHCMSGDTKVYFDLPRGVRNNKRNLYKLKLEDLYKKWNSLDALKVPLKQRIKKMHVRCYDEKTKQMTHAHIKEVFKTGIKDVYEIQLSNGKKIKSTKEHKVLTKEGFKSLEDCIGLNHKNEIAYITKNTLIACNGIPIHQDYEWLKTKKEESIKNKQGVDYIAKEANVSYHTIRKWLKKLNLKFTKADKAAITEIWNKGKLGYKVKPRTIEQKEYMRQITPKGKDHHAYKGGNRAERKAICNFFNPIRKEIFKKFNFTCQLCKNPFGNHKIDLHHIKEVSLYPELAREIENVIPVHRTCHLNYHGKTQLFKNKKITGVKKTVSWAAVKNIKYLGKMETYDLEMDHDSHNYVAEGVIVHNSQRYSKTLSNEMYEARRQDLKNKQNSINDLPEDIKDWFDDTQQELIQYTRNKYEQALEKGIAKEQARFLLLQSATTKLYMVGSIRSWVHYVDVRCDKSTQLEHRDIAEKVKTILFDTVPNVAEAMNWS